MSGHPGRSGGPDDVIVDGGGLPNIDESADVARKIYVRGVSVSVVAERVEYMDHRGKLVTESLRDFTKKELRKHFASLDDFLTRWRKADRKQALLEELLDEAIPVEALVQEFNTFLDPFDLICHLAYDQPPLTRRDRALNVRKRDVFTKYGPQARAVLEALLTKYEDEGVINLDDPKILNIKPLDSMG